MEQARTTTHRITDIGTFDERLAYQYLPFEFIEWCALDKLLKCGHKVAVYAHVCCEHDEQEHLAKQRSELWTIEEYAEAVMSH